MKCAQCGNDIRKDAEGKWIHVLSDRYGCKDDDGEYTGFMAKPTPEDELKRDAAPELYEALKSARKILVVVEGYVSGVHPIIDQIDAALAKAEGRKL